MQPHPKRNITSMNSCIDPLMQVHNQLEIESMHERLNDTRVPEDTMRVIRWKMRAILLPKYHEQKMVLRLESYKYLPQK